MNDFATRKRLSRINAVGHMGTVILLVTFFGTLPFSRIAAFCILALGIVWAVVVSVAWVRVQYGPGWWRSNRNQDEE